MVRNACVCKRKALDVAAGHHNVHTCLLACVPFALFMLDGHVGIIIIITFILLPRRRVVLYRHNHSHQTMG